MNTNNAPEPKSPRKIKYDNDYEDFEGKMRTEKAMTSIAQAFPEKDECWCHERFRGYLDDNGIQAESDSGWLSEIGALQVEGFIAEERINDE